MNILSLLSSVFDIFARGGGGGHGGGSMSSGGGGGGGYYSGGGSSFGSIFIFVIFIVVYFILKFILKRKSKNEPTNVASGTLSTEAAGSIAQQYIAEIFYNFQKDWGNNDSVAMKPYLTDKYHYNISLMLAAMQALGRQNQMQDVQLIQANILDDQSDKSVDNATSLIVEIKASATDSLVQLPDGDVYYTDTAPFSEYWYFIKEADIWKLDTIQQTTEAENVLHPQIANFAETNNFFYSGEWGNLLLPTSGQLFEHASFATSAINDHVIGYHNKVIIEFYTYLPNKNIGESYTIAQAVLPKSYGDIIVHHKSGLLNLTPRGLTKVETEWPDFNKKYNVYATSIEGATSLELLNPTFMVRLEALPFEVNIEVVDNIVYLHTKQTLEDYEPMLQILYLAFQEMKM